MLSMIFEKIGIKGIVGAVAGVVILAAIGYAVHKFESLVAENAKLRANYESTIAVNGQLAAQLKENQVALEIREKERDRLREETKMLNIKLEEVYKNDEKAFDWSVSGIPDGIIECVFQTVVPSAVSTGIAPCSLSTGNTGTRP